MKCKTDSGPLRSFKEIGDEEPSSRVKFESEERLKGYYLNDLSNSLGDNEELAGGLGVAASQWREDGAVCG